GGGGDSARIAPGGDAGDRGGGRFGSEPKVCLQVQQADAVAVRATRFGGCGGGGSIAPPFIVAGGFVDGASCEGGRPPSCGGTADFHPAARFHSDARPLPCPADGNGSNR
ncbi:unnamed protein product, partial [Urochloa humidicola]